MPATVVGLDIGRSAVRAVELGRSGRKHVVRRHGTVPLPLGAVVAGVIVEPAAVTEALRQLWREHKPTSRAVRLGVCSGSVLARNLELDWMPPQDLRRALRYQVADLLPVAVDDANLDHVLLGERTQVDPETGASRRVVDILLVATARGNVDELVRCVQAAGLRPVTADLSPLALVRAAAARAPLAGPSVTEAIIDVGSDKVAVAVHTAGVPHFVRVATGIGGELLTRTLSETTGLSWADAERAKLGPASSLEPEAQESLAGAVEHLVAEIRATLDFHSASNPEHVAERALVTGGGAQHPLFEGLCSRALGLPVEMLDPTALAGLSRRARDPEDRGTPLDLAVSIGLCLGETA